MEDKNKHLEFIQNTINRMATNSFILKGWTITLISFIFALAINNSDGRLVVLAIFPAFIFWGLDAYYLRQERLFRELYDYIRNNQIKDNEHFILDTKIVKDKVNNWFLTLLSPTIYFLHGAIVILISLTFLFM